MPVRNRSVMGGSTGVQFDDQDRANEAANARYLDQATKMYLAQSGSADARYGIDTQASLAREGMAAQRDITGTFGQRADQAYGLAELNNRGQLDVVRAGNEPAMAGINLQGRMYDDTAPAIKAKSQAEADKIQLMNALMKSFMPQAAAPGGAPGAVSAGPQAAGGAGFDQADMMAIAFGADPGDVLRGRKESGLRDRDREEQKVQQKIALASEWVKSTNPALRAEGAKILASTNGSPAFGMNPSVLSAGFGPQIDAGEALSKPSIRRGLDNTIKSVNSAYTDAGVPEWQAELAILRQKAIAQGAEPDEVDAMIQQILDEQVDAPSFMSNPISSTLDMLLPGTPITDNFSARGQKRKGLGLRPQR